MNILMLHNSYKVRGGEDESFESEWRMLSDAGHRVEVVRLANDQIAGSGVLSAAKQAIWAKSSFDLVEQKLKQTSFDVLHVQNFFPLLSPSVYFAARKHDVPVVQSLRNYRLLCPSAILFRDGKPCEECLNKKLKLPGIMRGCYRGSRGATAVVAAMTAIHAVKGTWFNKVDSYICLTEFVRQKFISAGFPAEKLLVKSNFVYPDPGRGTGNGGYVLFVGRLTMEKGVKTLLDAWQRLRLTRRLIIVGEGPLDELVRAASRDDESIQWLGPKSCAEVKALMGEASVLIFPSEWYETFGRVVIESFAKGTPVLASRLGAMKEIISDGRTGLLFEPGNADDLGQKLKTILGDPNELLEMRALARAEYEKKYTAEQNLRVLLSIYQASRGALLKKCATV
jgi:glycosyltransferase involved in cell wall biosynthesis